MTEELLEPIARWFRFHHGLAELSKDRPLSVADLGCGPKMRFYHAAKKSGISFSRYFGVDPLLDEALLKDLSPEIELVKAPLITSIALPDASVDFCVSFAFMEHIDHPAEILNDSIRIVKPGGKVILTTPSVWSKPVLEFLSFKLKIISPREIEEHKTYFTRELLESMTQPPNGIKVKTHHAYFEGKMNNFYVVTRLPD
jgi:SAM-dependent methyltransferase